MTGYQQTNDEVYNSRVDQESLTVVCPLSLALPQNGTTCELHLPNVEERVDKSATKILEQCFEHRSEVK